MLIGYRDVEAVFRLEEVPVLMLWQFVFKLHTCMSGTSGLRFSIKGTRQIIASNHERCPSMHSYVVHQVIHLYL